MAWWLWLILAWIAVAVVVACVLGLALRESESRDRLHRGRPGRRVDRHEDAEEILPEDPAVVRKSRGAG